MTTIEEAKKKLRKNMLEGDICPVCNQFVKVYKRSINGSSLLAMTIIYNAIGKKPVHATNFLNECNVPAVIKNTGDFAKLRFWGLIKEVSNKENNKSSSSGCWEITKFGEQFLLGNVNIPRYKFFYNNNIVKIPFEQPELPYKELVTKKFDYKELMNN